jgi:hypothetical protein
VPENALVKMIAAPLPTKNASEIFPIEFVLLNNLKNKRMDKKTGII